MELRKVDLCQDCTGNFCAQCERNENFKQCVFNLIIYEDDDKILFYNFPQKRIFKIIIGKGITEIDFKSAIREIDIIPTKSPKWKKLQILKLAKELGFFGI